MSDDTEADDLASVTCTLDFKDQVAVVVINDDPPCRIEVPFDWFDAVLNGLQALRRLVFEGQP